MARSAVVAAHLAAVMGLNSVLLVVAPAPAIVFSAYCRGEGCHVGSYQQGWLGRVLFGLNCCNWHYHPVVTVNQLLFWNLCVLFWIVSLIQKSTWVSTSRVLKLITTTALQSTQASHVCRIAVD